VHETFWARLIGYGVSDITTRSRRHAGLDLRTHNYARLEVPSNDHYACNWYLGEQRGERAAGLDSKEDNKSWWLIKRWRFCCVRVRRWSEVKWPDRMVTCLAMIHFSIPWAALCWDSSLYTDHAFLKIERIMNDYTEVRQYFWHEYSLFEILNKIRGPQSDWFDGCSLLSWCAG
jgi:hypothetical protein